MAEANEDVNTDEVNSNSTGDDETVISKDGVEPRRSERERKVTEKMSEYQEGIISKSHDRLLKTYELWRTTARNARKTLKENITDSELNTLSTDIKNKESRVLCDFNDYRRNASPPPELVRKIDACSAVSKEILSFIDVRVSGVVDYEHENEAHRLSDMKKNSYAKSVFSSITQGSQNSVLSTKLLEAAADLQVQQAEYEHHLEEQKQRAIIERLESDYRVQLEQQYNSLRDLEASKKVKIAQAKMNAYSQALNGNQTETNIVNKSHEPIHMRESKIEKQSTEIHKSCDHTEHETQRNTTDTQTFAQTLVESINLNRLPIPEPNVFVGNPLHFIEWKSSFKTLIERKCVPQEEKIFYLKRYTGGPARQAIEGYFYSSTSSAYDSAFNVLEERYGHPYVLQKAFRDKLNQWPKIGPKDPIALRNFGDFLRSCKDAMPHIPNLSILNDCNENQKLISKLPDWAVLRWNRIVTELMDFNGEYPNFPEFVDFVVREAKVACNPISSFYAMSSHDSNSQRTQKAQDTRKHMTGSRAFATGIDCNNNPRNAEYQYKPVCAYCNRDHFIFKCEQFLNLNLNKKREIVKNKDLCFGCLRKGHLNKDCQRKHTCGVCKKKHPTCLHENRAAQNEQDQNQTDVKQVCNNSVTNPSELFSTSMIVPVWVSSEENPSREILTYAMLDTQSDTTFILDDTAKALDLKTQKIKLSLSTMTSKNAQIDSSRVSCLKVRSFDSADHVIINHAYTRDFIPVDRSHIPQSESIKGWPHLAQLVDKIQPLQSCEVGLLIGYNCPKALAPQNVITGHDNEPYAVKTLLGWSIIGYVTGDGEINQSKFCHRTMVHTKEIPMCPPKDLIIALEKDFANDSTTDKKVSQNDIQFLNILENNIHECDNRHLEMPLPFKERPVLPNNRNLAVTRLNHLKRKLNDHRYSDHYTQYMKGLIERGEAEKVRDKGVEGSIWYIPHHAVYHPQKRDKIRVVFDCSARYSNTSLNDHLLTGPDLTNNLIGVLCRFRERPIAIMCDIEGMFHQFKVSEQDRDFLRFLWWEDEDSKGPLIDYRMTVHLFGAASSPGCANYGLKFLARSHEDKFPKAAEMIKNDFYVDDGLTSLETVEEAIQIIEDAREICKDGGLRLHKFISNNKKVIESIPTSERAVEVKDLDLTLEKLPTERALGVKWCLENDTFNFDANVKDQKATRRSMLSMVASIFDPLGFLAPVTLIGKRLLQEICKENIGWDESVPETIQLEWDKWVADLERLKDIYISRPLKPADFGKLLRIELHHFSDASSYGYGQCSYIRFVGESRVFCAFVIGKARVAPLKLVSIPRLELTAALLSAKMSKFLKKELTFHFAAEYFWTDSRVVLGYINNEAKRFHVFVANRVQMIHEITEPRQWYYVRSEDNPADIASRGINSANISSSEWLKGPSFLWNRDFQAQTVSAELQLGDPEIRTVRTLSSQTKVVPSVLDRIDRFSSWNTTVSVIARLQRLANGEKGTHPSTVEERQNAEKHILKFVQQRVFEDTITLLKTKGCLPKGHNMYPLDPILKDGLLCVGGRLRNAKFASQFKHPIILPKDGHVTMLIIAYVHEKTKHSGRGMTMNELRSCGFWILNGSKVVANFIKKCVICRKLRRPTELQRMADLPEDRVEPSPPFTYCGMDCFGPFVVKQGRTDVKRYGLIFTCMCSRAIHIEMLDDMTTDAFINGLRCFIAIRGAVRQIRSDQGSNFVGAKNEFDKAIKTEKLTNFLSRNGCDFIFNAPSASHCGGIWERQIRTVRDVLKSVLSLSQGRLDASSLRTLLYEVMSIVNSRPLTVTDINDPKALEPLTPNHILTAKPLIPPPPPGNFVKEDLYLRKRWRRVQYLLEQFWSRWRKEYMSQITLRQKWHGPQRNIQVGDIVLVKDIDLPRCNWPLARVVSTQVDNDNLVRRVKLKTSHYQSEIERSIHKLVVLIESAQ